MTPAATLTLDPTTVRLSDPVRATVAIEGAAPLVVAAPKDVLAGEAAEAWRVRPAGPAVVEILPDGRERWVQVYRLDPYLPGDALPVAFAPFEVSAGGGPIDRVEVSPRTVRVRTALTNPKPADARSITGVEDPPPGPGDEWVPLVPFAAAAAILLAVVAGARVRRKRAPVPLSPVAWAEREIADLDRGLAAGTLAPEAFAGRLADVLRTFTERQCGLPATRRTTEELAAAESVAAEVVPVLERCDLAKFAAAPPTGDECRELLDAARAAVAARPKGDGRPAFSG